MSKYFERFTIFAGVIFFLFVYPHGIHGDGFTRYDSLLYWLENFQPKPMVYSYVGPFFSAPLYFMGKLVKDSYWWVSRYNTILFLGLLFFFWRKVKNSFGEEKARRFSILLLAGSMFSRNITDYYGEIFSTLTICLALWFFTEKKWNKGLSFWILSVLNTPGTLVGASLSVCLAILKNKNFRLFFFPLLAVIGLMLETYWKFGNFFPNEYMGHNGYKNFLPYSGLPGFSYPLWFGALSILFSFGKGLLFFTPGLLVYFIPSLCEKEQWKQFYKLGLLYLAGLILVYARWWAWHGDWFWGPRFFLFATVLSVLGIFLLWERENRSLRMNAFLLFLVTLSVWISAQGIAFGNDDLADACGVEGGKAFFMCHYVPEMSALWRAFSVEYRPVNGSQRAFLIFHAFAYLVLTTQLWKEFVKQLFARAKIIFQDLTKIQNWKW